jgi:hypothetical protein
MKYLTHCYKLSKTTSRIRESEFSAGQCSIGGFRTLPACTLQHAESFQDCGEPRETTADSSAI